MAAVVAHPTFHSSGHSFAPYHSGFACLHQQPHYRPSTAARVDRNPFEAFGPRHHGGTKSRSAAQSWRQSESVDRTSTVTTPKYRRGGPSHSRTPSTSSEASSSSWRERSRSPAVAAVELQPETPQAKPEEPNAPVTFVYTASDLLRLKDSPLVGLSAKSQAIVDDLVAHHVWRRGPHQEGKRRRNRGISKQRSSSGSSTSSTADDSERLDHNH